MNGRFPAAVVTGSSAHLDLAQEAAEAGAGAAPRLALAMKVRRFVVAEAAEEEDFIEEEDDDDDDDDDGEDAGAGADDDAERSPPSLSSLSLRSSKLNPPPPVPKAPTRSISGVHTI